MLKTETMTINGKQYIRTWSDIGMMLERDGVRYEEAVDPSDLNRQYTETDEPVSETNEATEADYLAALSKLGVRADD